MNKLETRVVTETRLVDNSSQAAVDRAINEMKGRFSEYADVYRYYMADNPEHFYLCGTVTGSFGVDENGRATSVLVIKYSAEEGETSADKGMTTELKRKITAKKEKFNAELDRIVSMIPTAAPPVVKEKLIYDYLLSIADYNTEAIKRKSSVQEAPDDWSAYGVIMNHKGVCESYSEAFQLLCLSVGIECTPVLGEAEGGFHKWNAVKLDDEWYACDVTFDDPVNGVGLYHNYFNVTSRIISSDTAISRHLADKSQIPFPDCAGTKYSYKNYFS